MSDERKPQPDTEQPHREKQTMDQPQEEFVGDQAQPSRDKSEVRPGSLPGGAHGE